jgi:hypothetical protein
VSDVRYCARHPNVETGLACGRCETPICPRCAVFTDVGARCPDCAPRRTLPQFEISILTLARAAGAAAAAGAVLGAAWGLLLPGGFGFFMIFLGIGLGYGVGESVSWATNRKSGTALQVIAALGVVLAYFMRNALAAGDGLVPSNDFSGLLALLAGVVMAINRLRY